MARSAECRAQEMSAPDWVGSSLEYISPFYVCALVGIQGANPYLELLKYLETPMKRSNASTVMVDHEFEEDSAWATSESGSLDSHRWDGKSQFPKKDTWLQTNE